jgi:hypothetical protein
MYVVIPTALPEDGSTMANGLLSAQPKSSFDFCSDITGARDGRVPDFPQFTVSGGFTQVVVMSLVQQFQPDAGVTESDWFPPCQKKFPNAV